MFHVARAPRSTFHMKSINLRSEDWHKISSAGDLRSAGRVKDIDSSRDWGPKK